MKFVYVLVSDEKDLYLHQAVLSMRSLRRVMPDAEIILLVDGETMGTLSGNRAISDDLNVEVRNVSVPPEYSKKIRSRYLKLTVREEISGDFAYVDCDTIFCGDVSPFDCEIGMVIDKHTLLSEHPVKQGIERNAKRCGYHAAWKDRHFNGGFIWVKDCQKAHEFFRRWKEQYLDTYETVSQDQTTLNEVNYQMKGAVTELNAAYNCQISNSGSFVQYLTDARILHYFATAASKGIPYDLANEKILSRALEYPLDTDIARIINDPRKAFSCIRFAGNDPTVEKLMQTCSFEKLKSRYKNETLGFKTGEFILKQVGKIRKKMSK